VGSELKVVYGLRFGMWGVWFRVKGSGLRD
jgi:hypothetical protein